MTILAHLTDREKRREVPHRSDVSTSDSYVFPGISEATAEFPLQSDYGAREKTRAALLTLGERAGDKLAVNTLWQENSDAIEGEMHRHLHTSSDSSLLARILSGLVSQSRFFCDEVDDPEAWVARCANLEARRVAMNWRPDRI